METESLTNASGGVLLLVQYITLATTQGVSSVILYSS